MKDVLTKKELNYLAGIKSIESKVPGEVTQEIFEGAKWNLDAVLESLSKAKKNLSKGDLAGARQYLKGQGDTLKDIINKLYFGKNANLAEETGSNLDIVKRIVENKQYEDIKFKKGGKVLVDMQTANAMMTVYNAIKGTNKEKFEKLINSEDVADFTKATKIAWKLVK